MHYILKLQITFKNIHIQMKAHLSQGNYTSLKSCFTFCSLCDLWFSVLRPPQMSFEFSRHPFPGRHHIFSPEESISYFQWMFFLAVTFTGSSFFYTPKQKNKKTYKHFVGKKINKENKIKFDLIVLDWPSYL